eukprot:scaffold16087_cov112-Isochrysis_galbana.AAC.5
MDECNRREVVGRGEISQRCGSHQSGPDRGRAGRVDPWPHRGACAGPAAPTRTRLRGPRGSRPGSLAPSAPSRRRSGPSRRPRSTVLCAGAAASRAARAPAGTRSAPPRPAMR